MLLQRVGESGARDLHVRWRYFSLTQVNNLDKGWTMWAAAAEDGSTSVVEYRFRRPDGTVSWIQGFPQWHATIFRSG